MLKWMKKMGIWMLVFLWMLAGLQILANKNKIEEKEVSEVFSQFAGNDTSSIVKYYGKLDAGEFTDTLEEREQWLRKAAKQIGITDGMQVSRSYYGDSQITLLEKKGANASTALRLVTLRKENEIKEQTLMADILVKGNLETAMAVRRKLKKTLKEEMESVRSFVSIEGKYNGNLSLEERNQISDDILERLRAKVVSDNRDMELYTIYGYTPYLDETVTQDGEKINVNIMIRYNDTEDVTYISGAVPFSAE